ncbi:polyketide synthase dehydratase domain-containing protein, partial [bacterium AH-315-L15]|nr:polyketide synthase dehydratase domain-containing protein [bacterium AH-315-L15]
MNWGYWSTIGLVAPKEAQPLAQIGIGLIESPEGMQALETLLAGPMDQIGLMKITKPLAVEGMNPEELIEIYPQNFPPGVQNMLKPILQQDTHVQHMKTEGQLQIKAMDVLLSRLLWGQLRSIGLFTQKNPVITDLKTKIRDLYDRWLDESVAVLVRNNYLKYAGESCSVLDTTPVDIDAVWKEWDLKKQSLLEDPNTKARVVLVEATLRALPEILTGKVLATDIMFPNSSMELVEGIYKHNLGADYFNEVLANTGVAYIQERLGQDASAKIRILEIGAGTGGTSAIVFQKLQPIKEHIQEYCYTDLSKAFLIHAEKEYGPQNHYLTYKIFDVGMPIVEQGIRAGRYDLVIAANVLHATKNIRQTLRNTKAVLKKHGLILLNELSGNALFTHLTFGLLEGWWLYEDPELRIPGCPGLSPKTWQDVLEREGFRSVFFPAGEAHDLGQQIVVAESDGVVRQKQGLKSSVMPVKKRLKTLPPSIAKDKHLALQKTKTMSRGVDVTDRMVEDHVRTIIRESIAEALKIEEGQIQDDRSFSEYGVDSIIAVNLVNLINKKCNITLQTTIVFDYNNVDQLTQHIIQEHKSTLISLLQENVSALEETSRESQREAIPVAQEKQNHIYHRINRRWQRNRFQVQDEKAYQDPIRYTTLVETPPSIRQDSIAIIGMSGRFAKSKTVSDLWKHLSKGTDLIEEVSRWDLSEYYKDSSGEEKNYCNYGSFLEDIDQFDPLFFNISGLEATYMDPQQRFFLEECWKALEDAGHAGAGVGGRQCGVYVGCTGGDYKELLKDHAPAQAFWGNAGSIIPARIAYYLNLQGPAVAIDTACSSSLVAIHLACQGLWARETELALAGGVFIQSTPEFYISTNRAGMLSSTGRCHTFDERADGFVPGEGVGVVVLKRLKEALADGDHIYGVIRGSGLNQDGTTNGITAPSANSQERLERHVYDTFHIHPEQIQMVEAHGTGTILGDPIEYGALTRAFRKDTDKKKYCAIGSIKTNLGHAATAAGIAGVIKILLSLKHKQIPPSLHYQSGNPNIQFKESPFYVNTSLKNWDIESNSKRCAAISSFGFSGTNAHMVIEEAPKVERQHTEKPGYLIVLSARTLKQLPQQVEQMVTFCEQESQLDCGNMSYTLLLGRKHFNHRLACVIRSQNELVNLFKKWLGKGKVSQIYVSELHEKDHREQPSLKRYGNECIQNCHNTNNASDYLEHLSTIADLYIQGYALDFEQLFSNEQYSRISLPTYPFAKERYWIEIEALGRRQEPLGEGIQKLHPLLHQNTSDLSEQRFTSTFTGQEFFLADHVVKGQRVLPGVAYLEMARAAVDQAAVALEEGQTGIRLKNVVWARSIAVGEQPVQVHIGLFPEDNGEIAYEIYSESEDRDAEPVVHSQGHAALSSVADVPTLDIKALQAQCSQSSLSSTQCYKAFRAMGIDYGPGYQGIEMVYVGPGQVLAKLSLPTSVSDTGDQFVLHPSLMDSALQASVGLMMVSGDTIPSGIIAGSSNKAAREPALPLSLQELEILGSCTSTMWALIRCSDGSAAGDKVQKLDIDLCDETGTICVRMIGIAFQGRSQLSITQRGLQSITAEESIFSHLSDKPSGISLRSLSGDQTLSDRPRGQTQQSIRLSSTNISLPEAGINDESKPVIPVQAAIPAERLQEELTTSLAEALYMKRSDVDVDNKFI